MKFLWQKVVASILYLAFLTVPGSVLATAGYEEIIYYHNDALGSPVAATDASGDVLWREGYSPYGSRLLHQSRESDCSGALCVPVESSWDEKQWFTGKLEETRLGVQYFGARWYEPEIGRFLSVDPVQFQQGNPFTFNRYAYANDNPYKYTDPDGREVVQVGVSFALPEVMGAVQKLMGKSLNISGFSAGVAWSSPSIDGHGEFDIGIYMTTRLNGEGADTGRFAATYSQSLDDGATVKDLAGIGGGASVGFGAGGIDASYSQDGIDMMGMHIGPGAGVTVQGQATAIMSAKHGKIGWNKSSSGTRAVSSNRKKEQQ